MINLEENYLLHWNQVLWKAILNSDGHQLHHEFWINKKKWVCYFLLFHVLQVLLYNKNVDIKFNPHDDLVHTMI
jgi:hypothetical protein